MILLEHVPRKKRPGTRLANSPFHPTHPPSYFSHQDPLTLTRPAPTLPLDVLSPVTSVSPLPLAAAVLIAPTQRLTSRLTARSLRFNKLVKKFCKTSSCVVRRTRCVPEYKRSRRRCGACPTVGSDNDNRSKGTTRPAASTAHTSVKVRNMPPRGSRSARRAFSSELFARGVCSGAGLLRVGMGSSACSTASRRRRSEGRLGSINGLWALVCKRRVHISRTVGQRQTTDRTPMRPILLRRSCRVTPHFPNCPNTLAR